jgi:glycosyltransferase involved in cell wall biosynthesis
MVRIADRDKPVLDPIFAGKGKQLDFSSLEGEKGWGWSAALGHKQEKVPPMTIVRFINGIYGRFRTKEGKILVDGVALGTKVLDERLARDYPVNVHVLCNVPEHQEPYRIKEDDWRGEINVHPRLITSGGGWTNRDTQKILEFSREVDADIIHLESPDLILSSLVANGILEGKWGIAVTSHNIRCSEGPHNSEKQYAQVKKMGETRFNSDSLIGLSQAASAEFGNLKHMIIGSPIDSDFFNPEKVSQDRKDALIDRYGLKGKKVILCHGRIHPQKGQHLLVPIAEKIEAELEGDFNIIVAGPKEAGVDDRIFMEKLSGSPTKDKFIVTDGLDQAGVRDLLSLADVFVLTSKDEPLGRTGIEALMMKVPVVTFDGGGVGEFVIDGETGLRCRQGDLTGMSKGIISILRDSAETRRMGENGRRLAMANYSVDRVVDQYIRFVYGPMVLKKREGGFTKKVEQ